MPRFGNALVLPEIATPATPASGSHALYFKTDGGLYVKSSAGTEKLVVNSSAVLNGVNQWYPSASTANIANTTFQIVTGFTTAVANPAYYTTAFGTPSSGQATFNTAGTYLFVLSYSFASNSTGRRVLALYVNNAEVRRQDEGASSTQMTINLTHIQQMAVGDVVDMRVYQNSGGTLAGASSPGHDFQIIRIGE